MSPGQGDRELCRARHMVRFKSHCPKVTSPRVFRGRERRPCAPPLGSVLPPGIPPPPAPLSLQVPTPPPPEPPPLHTSPPTPAPLSLQVPPHLQNLPSLHTSPLPPGPFLSKSLPTSRTFLPSTSGPLSLHVSPNLQNPPPLHTSPPPPGPFPSRSLPTSRTPSPAVLSTPGPLSLQVPLQLCPQSSYTPLPYLHYPYTSFLLVPQLLSPLYMQKNPYPGSLPPPPWEINWKNGCSQGRCRAGGNTRSEPTGQWRGVRVARRVTASSQPGLCLRPSGHPSFSDLL